MSSAIVNLTVIAKRMLSKREAAEHCGRSLKHFDAECPVVPVRFPNGDLRYDVRDLDRLAGHAQERERRFRVDHQKACWP